MLASSKEYAIRMLDKIQEEVAKRLNEFKKASLQTGVEIDDFMTYRKATGKEMPYILLVMDEFHVLFNAIDELLAEATRNLSDGIKQWRKLGLGIMFCTQSIGGVKLGNAEEHVTYRFAFHLSPLYSKAVLNNPCAANLPKRGKVIMNNSASGDESHNVMMFHSSRKDSYLEHVKFLKDFYGVPGFYIGKPGLSDSIIESLGEEVTHAVASRKENISSVEEAHPVLTRNRHISDDYNRVRSCVPTKAEYDRKVSELMDRLREIRGENWKKTFKVIEKILLYTIGIVFVIIGVFFKLFFNHDDD